MKNYFNKKDMTKKINFSNFITLSKSINKFGDIKLENIELLNQYEIFDDDFDKIRGRGIRITINDGFKFEWFETDNKIIAYAVLNENNEHRLAIKKRCFELLSHKLYMYSKFTTKIDWFDNEFTESIKRLTKINNEN